MTDLLARLAAPFPPSLISWRVGSTTGDKSKGMALAYIDARDVQDRLNEVCGIDWQVRHPWSVGTKLACEIGILIDGQWRWRGDGAGDSDVEAEKGAFSDSFKRAAVRWGIGRYLYDIRSPWVELEAAGRSFKIKESEHGKLEALLARDAAKVGATAPSPATLSVRDNPKEQRANTFANTLAGQIDRATTIGFLNDLLNDPENKPLIARLQADYPKAYDIIRSARERKAADLTKAVA